MHSSTSLTIKIVKAPDPRLKIKTKFVKKINGSLLNTLNEMIRLTKTFEDPEGVGLAAPQIGQNGRFFVARLAEASAKRARLHDSNPPAGGSLSNPGQRKDRWKNYGKKFAAIINPQILSHSRGVKTYFEGCLSIPNIWGQVKRHQSIKVSYQDTKGSKITKTLKGIPAWIFQHEVDHLEGILFTERVLQQKGLFYKYTGKDKTGTDTFEEITLPL